ncbi:MAG: accessory Sec system translocase SecA2 [Chitinispirillia bacterium]|jgi:preprotein translocase subunit SecA
MINKSTIKKIKRYIERLNGSTIEYTTENYYPLVYEIEKKRKILAEMSDKSLRNYAVNIRESIISHENILRHMIESYALVTEGIWRMLNLQPFSEQITGALAMAQGKLIEMNTGEGKTLTAVYPAFLYGLEGKGVHVLTFNDYLAKRDALWMKPVYEFLGVSVGYVQEGMSTSERSNAYNCDITYVTAKESGFDFLRDGLCYCSVHQVHRNLHFAIIDEADSILIDEARIPLVIADSIDDEIKNIQMIDSLVKNLEKNKDYDFDEYKRNIFLTEHGIDCMEKKLNCANLFNNENTESLARINFALHAHYFLTRDVDYIVRNGVIEQVDEFTGRIADKRRWPNELQAAIEAKEHVAIQKKGRILNSISLQYFICLYSKKCGMTATARMAEEEFRDFYGLHTVVIKPHKKSIRVDEEDKIFCTKAEKKKALLTEIINVHKSGRPILAGTRSVAESIELSEELLKKGIQCSVLNAKNDEYEADIIANAGKINAVTISTNMAGRGVDIRLGGKNENDKHAVASLGGLYVIGTNKHESKRIDDQLRGRAARQGDPGSTRFFVSLEDDLFIRYRLSELIPPKILSTLSNGEIKNPIIRKEIDRVQRIVEGQNFEIKRTLSRYTYIIEQQRKIMYEKRKNFFLSHYIGQYFKKYSPEQFKKLSNSIPNKELNEVCKIILLSRTDFHWASYLQEMSDIRDGIHLRRFGGQDPLFEFQKCAIAIFEKMNEAFHHESIQYFNSIQVTNGFIELGDNTLKAPSSTWTYLINDKSFDDILGLQFLSNIGLSIGVIITWPFMLLTGLYKKIFKPYIIGRGRDI